MNALRRETERCDALDSFLLLQSLGGGTGSGLGNFFWHLFPSTHSRCVGAFVSELLRDEFPQTMLVNQVPPSFVECHRLLLSSLIVV